MYVQPYKKEIDNSDKEQAEWNYQHVLLLEMKGRKKSDIKEASKRHQAVLHRCSQIIMAEQVEMFGI